MNSEKNVGTRFLERPSFITGFLSLFDWAGVITAYDDYPTDEMADSAAMADDWKTVGKDIAFAMEIVREQIEGQRAESKTWNSGAS